MLVKFEKLDSISSIVKKCKKIRSNISYSDYVSEHIDKYINYSEYLVENLDKNISYSDYLAEQIYDLKINP